MSKITAFYTHTTDQAGRERALGVGIREKTGKHDISMF